MSYQRQKIELFQTSTKGASGRLEEDDRTPEELL